MAETALLEQLHKDLESAVRDRLRVEDEKKASNDDYNHELKEIDKRVEGIIASIDDVKRGGALFQPDGTPTVRAVMAAATVRPRCSRTSSSPGRRATRTSPSSSTATLGRWPVAETALLEQLHKDLESAVRDRLRVEDEKKASNDDYNHELKEIDKRVEGIIASIDDVKRGGALFQSFIRSATTAELISERGRLVNHPGSETRVSAIQRELLARQEQPKEKVAETTKRRRKPAPPVVLPAAGHSCTVCKCERYAGTNANGTCSTCGHMQEYHMGKGAHIDPLGIDGEPEPEGRLDDSATAVFADEQFPGEEGDTNLAEQLDGDAGEVGDASA